MLFTNKLIFYLVSFCVSSAIQKHLSLNNHNKSILDEDKCGDIRIMCPHLSKNEDLLVLECLQSVNPTAVQYLNRDCQQIVWNHTRILLQDEKVKEVLLPVCRSDLDKLDCKLGDGNYLKCIMSYIPSILNPECIQLIYRLESIAFTDFRFVSSFLKNCDDDIQRLQCGGNDLHGLSQAKMLICLQNNAQKVSDMCKKDIFKVSEMQSENIKLDALLYIDCAEDYSRYCYQFAPGTGKVFHCLLRQDQRRLSSKCRQHLLRRQKLISEDYRVSKGLMRACKDVIKKTNCRKQSSADKMVRLAQILLCIENTIKNGTKVDSNCEAEIIEHRRMLMEDYRLSPEIVNSCKIEISSFCNGLEVGGRTIHCLMSHSMANVGNSIKKEVSDACEKALEALIKQADVGENWQVDPVLHQACYPVVAAVCHDISEGDNRVMSCLMDNIGTDHMTETCEKVLIQTQYFIARDFKLDPQLYRSCKSDAVKYCHMAMDWYSGNEPINKDVLPCLYRYVDHSEMQLSKSCLRQIHRVMKQRAVSVDLQPEIELACLNDLGMLCHDKTQKGEEVLCLQKNLEKLNDQCRDAVELFTEIEAEHADLNPYINKYCRKVIDTLCNTESKNDEGDIMECLLFHKNDPEIKSNHACRVSIEHFQIISVKDYRFSYKFKIACKSSFVRFCGHLKTLTEVVHCLSEQVLNSTVHGVKSAIPKECKQQLRSQIFQQRENIDYDPVLKAACLTDIRRYCKDVATGNAQILECLQTVDEKLSEKCEKEIFKIKQQEIYDNTLDYSIITTCADAIDQFCPHHEKERVLDCLKMNKDQKGFDKKCRSIVKRRIVEQNSNYQLNPALQESCNNDIINFCSEAYNLNRKDRNGPIIKCLKEQFKQFKLSNNCEKVVADILREQALSIDLNPLIMTVCRNELETICRTSDEDTGENAEECLKNALLKNTIQTPECKVEVANMIEESQADIEVDPVLQRACALDLLNFCTNVPQGNSRHILCLKTIMEDSPQMMSTNCKNMLKKRIQMYRNAAQFAPPADLQQLYSQVVQSPEKYYLLIMIGCIVCIIFVIGIFCGSYSKRKYKLLKNR